MSKRVSCELCSFLTSDSFCSVRNDIKGKIKPKKKRFCDFYELDEYKNKSKDEKRLQKPIATLRPEWYWMTRSERNKLTLRQTKGEVV